MKNSFTLYNHPGFTFLTGFFVVLLLNSCKPAAPKAAEGTGDLSGYIIEDIPGSTTKYAVKKNAADQMAAEGFITNDKRSGQWVEYSPEGEIILIENYVDGLREGLSIKMSTRGQMDMKSRYKQGDLHGQFIQYKFGKIVEDRTYANGKLDGLLRKYDDRTWKLRKEMQYKQGELHGFFRHYDDEGNVTLEYQYENGVKLGGGIIEKK